MGRKNALGAHLTGEMWDTVWQAKGYGPVSVFVEAHPELNLTAGQVSNIWTGQTRRPGWIQEKTMVRRYNSPDTRGSRCGLSVVEQVHLYDAQDGRCFLGDHPVGFEETYVEHDHAHLTCNGKGCPDCVRGLACGTCNSGIGMFKDDPDRMRIVADNLERAIKKTRAKWQSAAVADDPSPLAA